MQDLALSKPTRLSSSLGIDGHRDPAIDGRYAVTENEDGDFVHSGSEQSPFWEVDLGQAYALTRIELYNRRDFADRLQCFAIYVSLDYDEWRSVYRKIDSTVFGHDEVGKLVVSFDAVQARHIRVISAEFGVLHFRRLKAFGEPMTSDAAASAQAAGAARIRALIGESRGRFTMNGGFNVFLDEVCYTPNVLNVIQTGGYEFRERMLISMLVRPGDRILEAGTAIGLVSMTAAAKVGPENVFTYDANPQMIEDARRNFAANALSLRATNGVLRNRSRVNDVTMVDFYIAHEFWSSRLNGRLDDPGVKDCVRVPFYTLEDEIERYACNVLIVDIEGGEIDLLIGADLSRIRLIIMEIHFWSTGEAAVKRMTRYLIQEGFDIDLVYTKDEMIVFERASA